MAKVVAPWEAHGPDAFGDFIISSKGEELAKCVVVQNGFRTPEETAAIAAHLIKAVNNHNALVKHLHHLATVCCDEDALRLLDSLADPVGGPRHD